MNLHTMQACRDELLKISSSALRSQVQIVPKVIGRSNMGADIKWVMKLGDETIGYIRTQGRNVKLSQIDERFKGMGLGKKMYGEVMRRMPKQDMASDTVMTDASQRVWKGMPGRSGYNINNPWLNPSFRTPGTLFGNPVEFNVAPRPHFRANLPPEAAIPTGAGKQVDPTSAENWSRRAETAAAYGGALLPLAGLVGIAGGAAYLGHREQQRAEERLKNRQRINKPEAA